MNKVKIGAIYDRDMNEKTDEYSLRRIGRVGEVLPLAEGNTMIMKFKDSDGKYKYMRTSNVQKFKEKRGGCWVTTENSVYRLDNDYEK